MSQIVLDDQQLAATNGLQSMVEVSDSKGEFVGYLISRKQLEKYMYSWAWEQFGTEDQKLDPEEELIPHEEVMKHLNELAKQ